MDLERAFLWIKTTTILGNRHEDWPDTRTNTDTPGVIKYLGSKRLLIDRISGLVARSCEQDSTVIDLFSGTSRVGHALKRAGYRVLANDHNRYAHTLATCYVQADAERVLVRARAIIEDLMKTPPEPGFITETYCVQSRYFHPDNGARIDAIRARIDELDLDEDLRAVVLTSLVEAADRVDSTTGVQMAYLKSWAPRASNRLSMRIPDVLPAVPTGRCESHRLEAIDAAKKLTGDLAYLDPPYNQHSYLGNYHLWETLVTGDQPETYGVARKRSDCKDRKSPFNSKLKIEAALREVIQSLDVETVVLSFSDEGYLSRDQIVHMLSGRGRVAVIENDHPRYVGCKIGIHNHNGDKVGTVGKVRNKELLFVAGEGAERLFGTKKDRRSAVLA
ncbi:MAG: DNA adenine methylase [Phycisphaerales bacterium]|nr:DNA adenine methylase [Phycisphaerales bacterium]